MDTLTNQFVNTCLYLTCIRSKKKEVCVYSFFVSHNLQSMEKAFEDLKSETKALKTYLFVSLRIVLLILQCLFVPDKQLFVGSLNFFSELQVILFL